MRWLAFLALTFLPACAQLGIPTAQTFDQKLAVSYSAITAARNSAITLLSAGKITPDDAQNVQNQCDNIRSALDLARVSYKAGDTTTANTKLDTTITALTALQAYLTSKGAK